MSDQAEWEEKFIRAYVQKHRRPRYRSCLWNEKNRWSALDRLNHANDFIPELTTRLEGQKAKPASIEKIMKKMGAGQTCWLMSSDEKLDGHSCSLKEGIAQVVVADWGTVLICPPEPVALYRPEASEKTLYLLA